LGCASFIPWVIRFIFARHARQASHLCKGAAGRITLNVHQHRSPQGIRPIKYAVLHWVQPFMLLSPFEPRRLALLRQACCLATLALSVVLIGWSSATLAQTPSAAEEAIKKAIQAGQLDQARQLVQKERKNAPQAVQWRFMEGVIQAQQGQIDKAIETFKQITQTHPEQSEAYNNLGVLYAAKGQLEASKASLEKALQTHPSYAAAHRNLSDVHSQLAKQSYAKALQVDPKAKASAPQLTLLGSMGTEQRGQPPAQSMASLTHPAAAAPGQAASQAPTTAAAAAPASAPTASASAARTAPVTPAKPSPPVAVAPPAAAPAAPSTPPPAASPAADTRQAERAAIEKAVQDWAKAWSDKDMARYYAAYASNFTPANRASRAQWESDRRIRIVSKKSISVKVRELQISFTGETASARFQQLYSSDNLKGSSRKTLDMVRQGNRWLIVRESVN
jgi:tetratricopeptide (TPR) repeat protein